MDVATIMTIFTLVQLAFRILNGMNLFLVIFSKTIPSPPPVNNTFSFIIVGAGSTGSVVANRLSEIPTETIALFEAGGDPTIESLIPSTFAYIKNTSVDWSFVTEDDGFSQQFHNNHGARWPRGKMLGGSSGMNFMIYVRGNHHDYNTWANITGDERWNWENCLKDFIKSEKLVDPIMLSSPDKEYHGTNGYVGTKRYYDVEAFRYLEAFEEVGHPIVLDTNGRTPIGYTQNMFNINVLRQSTAVCFILTAKNRPNFYLFKDTLVTKILFDENKKAIGVEALNLKDNSVAIYKATKEVIISAGVIGSPHLLMLSGIGPKAHLEEKNIKVLADLPVGKNISDHLLLLVSNAMGPLNPPRPAPPTEFPLIMLAGYAALNESQDYPDYQTFNIIVNDPIAVTIICYVYLEFNYDICQELLDGTTGREGFHSAVIMLYPESRGEILLNTTNPRDQPLIYTGYYSNRTDINKHAEYFKHYLKVHNSSLFRSVNASLVIPKSCGCGPHNNTDEFYRCYVLCMHASVWHPVGSCAMTRVVDSSLKVYGVNGLRVADASIMPTIPGGNTNAPSMMIGEKVSNMIKKQYYPLLNIV